MRPWVDKKQGDMERQHQNDNGPEPDVLSQVPADSDCEKSRYQNGADNPPTAIFAHKPQD
jgi:hypothetical protein